MRKWVPHFRIVWPKHNYKGGHPRTEACEPIVFQELRKLELRNSVSSKEGKTSDSSCLQEMAVMFACLKSSDFKESACTAEIQGFQKCYVQYEKEKKARKETEGELQPGAKVLTSRQLNILLKRYPQHNK